MIQPDAGEEEAGGMAVGQDQDLKPVKNIPGRKRVEKSVVERISGIREAGKSLIDKSGISP